MAIVRLCRRTIYLGPESWLATRPTSTLPAGMSAFSTPSSTLGGYDADLLLEISQSLLETAQVAWRKEADNEDKTFYSHLQVHCPRLVDQLSHSRQARLPLHEHFAAIIPLFGSIVAETGLQELPPYSVSFNFRLRALNQHWSERRCHPDELKLDFIRQWLRLKASAFRRELDSSLEKAGDGLTASHARDSSTRSTESFTPLPKIPEPSYAVERTAQSIFNALVACKACNCNQQHEFAAKLSLGTYRVPTGNPSN